MADAPEAACQKVSQRDDDEQFGNFGGLNANADVDPAFGASIPLHSEVEDHHQQDEHEQIQPEMQAGQQSVIQQRKTHHKHQTQHGKADLVRHARDQGWIDSILGCAADHKHAEEDQQHGDAEEEIIEALPDIAGGNHESAGVICADLQDLNVVPGACPGPRPPC